jgi:hypothetical protein
MLGDEVGRDRHPAIRLDQQLRRLDLLIGPGGQCRQRIQGEDLHVRRVLVTGLCEQVEQARACARLAVAGRDRTQETLTQERLLATTGA